MNKAGFFEIVFQQHQMDLASLWKAQRSDCADYFPQAGLTWSACFTAANLGAASALKDLYPNARDWWLRATLPKFFGGFLPRVALGLRLLSTNHVILGNQNIIEFALLLVKSAGDTGTKTPTTNQSKTSTKNIPLDRGDWFDKVAACYEVDKLVDRCRQANVSVLPVSVGPIWSVAG